MHVRERAANTNLGTLRTKEYIWQVSNRRMKIGFTPVSTFEWHLLSLRGSSFYSFFVVWKWRGSDGSNLGNSFKGVLVLKGSVAIHGRELCSKPFPPVHWDTWKAEMHKTTCRPTNHHPFRTNTSDSTTMMNIYFAKPNLAFSSSISCSRFFVSAVFTALQINHLLNHHLVAWK